MYFHCKLQVAYFVEHMLQMKAERTMDYHVTELYFFWMHKSPALKPDWDVLVMCSWYFYLKNAQIGFST